MLQTDILCMCKPITVFGALFRGKAESPCNTMSPGPRPTSVLRTKWHLDSSNHLATIHQRYRQTRACIRQPRTVFGARSAPFRREAGSPSNTMSHGLRLPPYQVASWYIQPFGHNRHGPRFIRTQRPQTAKIGGVAVPLSVGLLGSHLTPCGLSRGIPLYQVTSWSTQPFGHNIPTFQTDRTWQLTDR